MSFSLSQQIGHWALAQWHQSCSGSRQDFRLIQLLLAETLGEFRYENKELWERWANAQRLMVTVGGAR